MSPVWMVPAYVRVEAPTWEAAEALLPQDWCDGEAPVEVEGGEVHVGWLQPEHAEVREDMDDEDDEPVEAAPFGPLTLREHLRCGYVALHGAAPSERYLDALAALAARRASA